MGRFKNNLYEFEWWLKELDIELTDDDDLSWFDKPGICYLYEVYVEEQKNGNIDNTIKIMKLAEAMVQAGKDHHKIQIKYIKKNGEMEDYQILPLDIDKNICSAIDCTTNDLKDFLISRITEIKEIVNEEQKGE